MANTHSIEIFGTTFGPDEVFGPLTLRAMFGASLPFTTDHTGAVPVLAVATYLQHVGNLGCAEMLLQSEIVLPGTAEAIEEF